MPPACTIKPNPIVSLSLRLSYLEPNQSPQDNQITKPKQHLSSLIVNSMADELYRKLMSRNKRLNSQIERHGKEYKERNVLRQQLHKAIEEEYMRILEDDYSDFKQQSIIKAFRENRAARLIWRRYVGYRAKKLQASTIPIGKAQDKTSLVKPSVKARKEVDRDVSTQVVIDISKLAGARRLIAHARLKAWYPILVARWRGRDYHPRFLAAYESKTPAILKIQSWFRGSIARSQLYWRWVMAHHRRLRRKVYTTKRTLWRAAAEHEAKVVKTYCSIELDRMTLEAYRKESMKEFENKWGAYEAKLDRVIERNFTKSSTDWVKVGDVWMNAKKVVVQTQSPLIDIKAKNKQKLRAKAIDRLEKHFAAPTEDHGRLVDAFEAQAPGVLEEARMTRCRLLN